MWRGAWECVQMCRCPSDRRGDQGRRAARKTSSRSTVTFGDKLGDQLGTRTTRMVRDEQPAAIDERALLDQVDDPDFVQQIVS